MPVGAWLTAVDLVPDPGGGRLLPDRDALHGGQGAVLPRRGAPARRRTSRCSRRSATCWPRARGAAPSSELSRGAAAPGAAATRRVRRARARPARRVVAGLLGQHVAEDLGQPAAPLPRALLGLLSWSGFRVHRRSVGSRSRSSAAASSQPASNLGRTARQPVCAAKWSLHTRSERASGSSRGPDHQRPRSPMKRPTRHPPRRRTPGRGRGAARLGADVVDAARRVQRGEHRAAEVVGVDHVRPVGGVADADPAAVRAARSQ